MMPVKSYIRATSSQILVRLLNIKNIGGVSDNCFDELLSLIKDALPNGVALPKNFHDAKKFVKDIGVSYECIDTYPNDCILFKKQYADATICPVCHASRWKSEKVGLDGRRVHRVPQKVVRHFPLKRRLQRLFMSSRTAPLMRWHEEGRTKDGATGDSWMLVTSLDFKLDPSMVPKSFVNLLFHSQGMKYLN